MSVAVLHTGTMVVLRAPDTLVTPMSFPVSNALIDWLLLVPTTIVSVTGTGRM